MNSIARRLARVAAAALLSSALGGVALARDIVDSAGRTVTIPDEITVVYPAGNPAGVLLYVMKPEAMAGWTRRPREQDMKFLIPDRQGMRAVGRLTAEGNAVNLEALARARPDLILDFGTVDPGYADFADRIQTQAALPYVLIDGRFGNTPAALRLVGDILGVPERGAALAAFAEQAFADVDAVLAQVPPEQRPRVYLARGPEGLETGAPGSINAEIIERAGGVNVVASAAQGLVNAAPEQIIVWAPDTIVTMDKTFATTAIASPNWQAVPAVANGRVLVAPDSPFGFIDTPPGINRLIGLYWLLAKFYPDTVTFDLAAKVSEFYTLFYGVTPSAAQIEALLAGA
jgi:iron complex transport system substrate-binding protein